MTGKAPISILQLRSSAGLYGADRMVLALDQGLRQQGVRSRLLSINNYLLDNQPLHDCSTRAGQDAVLLLCRGKLDMRTVTALGNQIDQCAADVLHVHDYKSAFYAWLATRRRPHVKLIATLHGWVESSRALRLYNTLEIALLRRFDQLVVVSSSQVNRLSRAGIPVKRICQIDNGIAISSKRHSTPDELRAGLGLENAGHVFAAVGRLSAEKNLALLLDAFTSVVASHPDARLLLAGDGPERQTLQEKTGQLGLQGQVSFAGNRTDMEQIYPLLDCLVLPSLSEGMPLVVLEAMSRGIPVIASAAGEIPRLLANSQYGHVVPVGDERALRMAMIHSVTHPGRHDAKAREYVETHHSIHAMAGRYLDVYQSLGTGSHERKSA